MVTKTIQCVCLNLCGIEVAIFMQMSSFAIHSVLPFVFIAVAFSDKFSIFIDKHINWLHSTN